MNAQNAGIVWSVALHAVVLLFVWSLDMQTVQVQEPPLLLDLNILEGREAAAAQEEPAPGPVAAPPVRPKPEELPPAAMEKPVAIEPVARKVRTRKKVVAAQRPPKEQNKQEEPARQKEPPPVQESAVHSATAASTTAPHARQEGQGRTDSAAAPQVQRGGIYSLKEIEGALTPLERTEPAYPSSARRRNIEGWVQVQFVVNELGTPEAIRVLAAEPEGVFESSVVKSIGRWRFRPGTVKGTAVRVLVEQTIRFQLR